MAIIEIDITLSVRCAAMTDAISLVTYYHFMLVPQIGYAKEWAT
jgi:hypothetical protein